MLAVLLLSTASESALARKNGRGVHSGARHFGAHRLAVGVILTAPAYRYFPAPIYSPPVVAVPAAPPVYIERGDPQPGSDQSAGQWWYYCADATAYYPYVQECAGEWQRVAPEPPASR